MEYDKIIQINQFGGPEQLCYFEEKPGAISSGQVRVEIQAIGVNRADVLLRAGRYHDSSLPAVPGFEASGVIIETTTSALPLRTRVLVYDRGPGLYRNRVIVDQRLVVPIPDRVSFEVAAALPVNWLSAWYSIHELLRLKSGQSLLITAAASGVGLAAIQLARSLGLKIIAAAGSDEKLALCREQGAHYCVNYNDTAWPEKVREITGGQGVDAAMDIVGGAIFRPTMLSLIDFGAMVAMANVTTEDSIINTLDFYPKNITIHGFQLGSILTSRRWDAKAALSELLRGVEKGSYRPVIHKVFKLHEADLAHRELESRRVCGKVVLV